VRGFDIKYLTKLNKEDPNGFRTFTCVKKWKKERAGNKPLVYSKMYFLIKSDRIPWDLTNNMTCSEQIPSPFDRCCQEVDIHPSHNPVTLQVDGKKIHPGIYRYDNQPSNLI
jgi:hypothetical protein